MKLLVLWQPKNNSIVEHESEFVLHALRHTYGSALANAGKDAFRAQKVMGHKNITTTQGYVKVSFDSLKSLPDVLERRVSIHVSNE